MPDTDKQLEWNDRGAYSQPTYDAVSYDEEFVAILTLAMEQGSPINILTELLKHLSSYEQQCGVNLDKFQRRFVQGEDDLPPDFLSWSEAYYRFIALSSLLGGRTCAR